MKARAARLVEHGKPIEIEEVDLAEPGEGEVVVDMAFAGVNPVDHYGALGRVAPDAPLPRTIGSEGSGRVDGRPVMLRGFGLGTSRDGLWAAAAVAPEAALINVPDGVDLRHAAAMGVAGVTAWRTVTEKAQVGPDDRVLVLGASGGVGSIVVSVAHALGATVWGQTGSADKAEWVRERGADEVVVADAGALGAKLGNFHPTVVFDPLGGGFFGAAVEALAPCGRLVLFGTSSSATGEVPLQQLYRKGLTVFGYAGLIESDEDLSRGIRAGLEALRDGRLEVVVDRVLPLADVNQAFELIAGRGVQGKLLLDLN
ncbi:MAG: quinone oxidoreductase family protein [Acidimicrobiales bacterium]